ncbi:unnamed protein product [Aureobasidium vineae]|uniref:C2H2-type domain-containing protein n=1 Tax=Aureobasidium vineae TaxID=2773715 RepID=A0A9N8J8Z7_9PEZI|nr:unnamed protein product [Aureobasidium vineae]
MTTIPVTPDSRIAAELLGLRSLPEALQVLQYSTSEYDEKSTIYIERGWPVPQNIEPEDDPDFEDFEEILETFGDEEESLRFTDWGTAERHQDFIHSSRSRFWSCEALDMVETAFHASNKSWTVDVCGYCGAMFTNPADWKHRRNHIVQTHGFGKCKEAKRFYSADHFRQHIKDWHAGTSGIWTDEIVTACMREPPSRNRAWLRKPFSSPGHEDGEEDEDAFANGIDSSDSEDDDAYASDESLTNKLKEMFRQATLQPRPITTIQDEDKVPPVDNQKFEGTYDEEA